MKTLDLLKNLVAIPSIFPHEQEIAKFLIQYLRRLGFSVQTVMTDGKRPNIVATFGEAKKYLAFYGHMDTVARDEKTLPYKVVVRGKKAYGLGVADMKGGLSAILQAGKFARDRNLPVKIVFGVDEENISEGAHDLISSESLKDIGFMIVAESGQASDLNQPFAVCFGRKGRILLEAKIGGKRAHAAEGERGVNAIEQAAKAISLLTSLRFQKHRRLGKTTVAIHSIEGNTDSFSVPDTCTIQFSLLTTPNIKSHEVIQAIQAKAKKQGINLTLNLVKRKTPYSESYEVKYDSFLHTLEERILRPRNITPLYATSVADENVFANRLNIPVVTLGPIGGGDHTVSEWLDLTSLVTVEDIYKQIIELYNKM